MADPPRRNSLTRKESSPPISIEVPEDPTVTSDDKLEVVQKLFDTWDLDGSGYVEHAELAQVMQAFNELQDAEAKEEADWLMEGLDSNSDGKLDRSEFNGLLLMLTQGFNSDAFNVMAASLKDTIAKVAARKAEKQNLTPEQIVERRHSRHSTVLVGAEEIGSVIDKQLDREQGILEAFQNADTNKNGTIEREEFEKLINDINSRDELVAEAEVKEFIDKEFHTADADGNNTIEYEEFVKWYNKFQDWCKELKALKDKEMKRKSMSSGLDMLMAGEDEEGGVGEEWAGYAKKD